MANNNSERIDDLVAPEALKQLTDLDDALEKSYQNMEKLLKPTQEVEKALSKASTGYKNLVDVIARYEAINKQVNTTHNQTVQIQNRIESTRNQVINSTSNEARELASLRQELTENNRETQRSIRIERAQEGSLNQLRAILGQLTHEWDSMGEAARESVDGQNLLQNLRNVREEVGRLERLTGRSQRDVGSYTESIVRAFGQITSGNFRDGLSSLRDSFSGMLSVLGGNLMTKAVDWLGQLASTGIEFIKSGVEIANKAEGITTAFGKLGDPDLLKTLREDTRGLVSDLTLMQSSVKANTFGIPLDNLGKLLKFAQQRAQETGESVDYLVESIINGIGRKSPLILDNLGISASRLQEEVKKSGDFASAAISIVNEELSKQGDLALTGADRATQASVKWENAQLAVGQKFQWLGGLWDKISGGIADKILGLTKITKDQSQAYQEQLDKVVNLESNIVPLLSRYDELKSKATLNKEEQAELNKIINTVSASVPSAITSFDKYGNALSINTQKVYDFISAEKVRLKLMFGDQLPSLQREKQNIQNRIENLDKLFELNEKRRQFASDEERQKFEKKLAIEKGNLEDVNAQINYINGTTVENEVKKNVALNKQRAAFNQMTKKQLDQWIKDEKNAGSQYLEIAKNVYGLRFSDTNNNPKDPKATTSKSNDTQKRLDAERKAIQELEEFRSQQSLLADKRIIDSSYRSLQDRKKFIGETMKESFGDGNVDLLARPMIDASKLVEKGWKDAGEGIATVFSSQFGILDKDGKEVEILVTPILPNGDVMSPGDLEDYIDNVLQGNDILKADNLGIVIAVDVDKDGKSGERLHELQELYYETYANIATNEKDHYNNQLSALKSFTENQKSVLELSAKNQISNLDNELKKKEISQKGYQASVNLINEKLASELVKIDEESAKTRETIQKDYAERIIKQVQDRITNEAQIIERAENAEMQNLSSAYKRRELTTKQYEDKRLELTRRAAMDRMDAEISSLEELLNRTDITEDQKLQISKQLADARLDFEKYVNEAIISDEEKTAEKRLQIEQKLSDKRKELLQASMELISTLFSAQTESQLAALDKQSEANDDYFSEQEDKIERLADAGAISDEQAEARKAALAQQQKDREASLEQQKKEINQRQAKFEKAQSVATIAINTASAIMKNTAMFGWPASIPLNILTAALGAAQIATVLATPIPEYAKGTDDHKGGLAVVGDGGRSELVITPDNKMYKTPSRSTLVDLPAGSQVMPDFNKAILAMSMQQLITPILDNKTIVVAENERQIELAAQNNKLLSNMGGQIVRAIRNTNRNNSLIRY